MKKTLVIFLTIMLILSIFAGCKKAEDAIDFIYPFSGDINSFDPQVASTADEFLVIENCFEGLIRINDDGSVQEGVATDWSISSDNLTYTFYLDKNAKWLVTDEVTELMGEKFDSGITADDFVFALQRAADPDTDSPLYSEISAIKNAPDVHSGKMSVEKLGVTATDSYTLIITLSAPDENFLSALTTAAAMPCNRSFFNKTNGRYGLGVNYSMFNGQFYVKYELEASYLLKANESYAGKYPAFAEELTLKITDESSNIIDSLKNGYYDAAYISGADYETLSEKDGITATAYSDKLQALLLNCNNSTLCNEKIRQALYLSFSPADLSDVQYLSKAGGFIPPSCTVGNESYQSDISADRNTQKAETLWKEGLQELQVNQIEYTVITTEDMEDYVKQFIQGVQSSLGKITSYGSSKISLSIKIVVMSRSDLGTAVTSGEYDIALYTYEAVSQSPAAFLSQFASDNLTAFDDGEFSAALLRAQNTSANGLKEACLKCEKALMNTYSIIPCFFESGYYAQAKGVSGVQFHPGSGRVSFVNATREK